jgi:predicted neutral ceramidase superfamily lipid hydrolase
MTKVDPIDQAVRDAKKALRQAETVQRNRKIQMRSAAYYLEKIAEFRIDVSSEGIELLRKTATRQGGSSLASSA